MNVMVVILRPVGGPAVHGPNDTLEVLSQSFRTPRFYPDLCPLSAELLLEVEEFAAEGGVCSLPCYFFGLVFPTVDFPVHFLLVLVVIRERGMDLRERKMRMFTVYLFRAPTVGKFVSYDFDHLGVRADNPCDTSVVDFDVGCDGRRHRRHPPP